MEMKRKRSVSGLVSPASSSSTDLNSRTLKRFRDTRPPEHQVHQRTLGLLYAAQQRPPPEPADPNPPPQPADPPPTHTQQSLHRFWSIPSEPPRAAAPPDHSPAPPTSCEDCGAGLADGEDAGGEEEGSRCGACGKAVCFSCSVSEMGERRRCLRCARRRARSGAGGVGWTSAGVFVC